jgi:two-component system NtrC family sensor kinase
MGSLSKSRGNLFRKYMVIFVTLIGVASLTSGFIEIYFVYQQNKAAEVLLQQEKAIAAASQIEQFVKETEHQIAWTTHYPWNTSSEAVNQRRLDYLRLLRQVPAITAISQLDPLGMEQLRVSRLAVDVIGSQSDLSRDPKFFLAKTGKTYFSPVYFLKESADPYMTIAMVGAGQLAGVTVAEVNLKFISELVSQIKIGEGGYAYVVDTSGQLIAHPDISLVLRRTDLSSLPQVQAALAASAEPATLGRPQVSIERNLQKNRVLTTYQPIAPLGWTVFLEQPLNEAFAPLYDSILRAILLVIIGLGLSFLASVVMARKMVAPILALQSGAARIGAGMLDQTIRVRTGDELEELGEEFNRMSTQLRASYASLNHQVEEAERAAQDIKQLADSLEHRVAERTAELTATNSELEAFSYSVSHDLRTPLRSIDGFSQALLEDYGEKLDSTGQEYLRRVRAATQRMGQLIDDLLGLSRTTRTKMEVQDVDLSGLVEAVAADLKQRQPERQTEFAIAPGAMVKGDGKLLRIALENLLGNSWKFTAKQPQARIEFGVTQSDGKPAFFIRDNGAGFDMAYADKLFGAFQRLHKTDEFEGSGIGLATVQRVIHRHGGRIWAEGAVGKGATFYFTILV